MVASPACLYKLGIFMTIDLQASRKRIRPLVETTDKGGLDLWMATTCILPLVDNRCVAHRLLSHEVSIFRHCHPDGFVGVETLQPPYL